MATTATAPPADGQLVSVRGQRWVVAGVEAGNGSTLVSLQSVEDGRYGHTLDVIWEVEAAARVLATGGLPSVTAGKFDPPQRLAAFLDAVRWSAVTSAEVKTLQAPFRSGVAIEDYQLEPVARAAGAPRVNLLLADDVGLGKTIEAGLVAQELLLRRRARRIMVVCPAGLTLKWRDEMLEKFGLPFTIVDSERAAAVRRTHGSAANPFRVHPLTIVSLPWLRGPKAQRLLDEVLPVEGQSIDLLILDEAHHVGAVDSQQAKLMRRIAPHFTHRLFLSATPHNGSQESFRALLEMVDGRRFLRGVEPDPAAVRETVIRRLKSQIKNADGSSRFAERVLSVIPVDYPQEREVHALLARLKAPDFVTRLLKKRLFSSPAAFAHTVEVLRNPLPVGGDRAVEDFDLAGYDDEQLAEAEDDALRRTASTWLGADEEKLLVQMHSARPAAKARALIDHLKADGERVVVFTEYRDTLTWLADLVRQEVPAVVTLHGGTPAGEREQIRLAFQADPAEHPVRILIATDAASEGIDLQNHCHRLINFDVPPDPNRLEQRIGRIDRYGQKLPPDIRHFAGEAFEAGPPDPLPGEPIRHRRADLDRTVAELGITPSAVKRVVDTALELTHQQKLRPHTDGTYTVPPLTGSWQRATAGLTAKLRRPGEDRPRQLPITFDAEVIRGRDNIVLAHLNHPLVAMSTRLLRATVSNPDLDLHRVTAVVSDDPGLEDVLVGVYCRFVLTGADGVLLHEEILLAGGRVSAEGVFQRLEDLSAVSGVLDRPARPIAGTRLAELWLRITDDVHAAIKWCAANREEVLKRGQTAAHTFPVAVVLVVPQRDAAR